LVGKTKLNTYIAMKKVILLLLAVLTLLATTAVTTAAQIPHHNRPRNHFARTNQDQEVRMGINFGVNGGDVKCGVFNSINLGLAELGLDVLCPLGDNEEEKTAAFLRAGLRFSSENFRIGPDVLAAYDEEYRLGVGCSGEYRFMERFHLSLKVYATYKSHIEDNNDVTLKNARMTLIFGVATDIF
jgi:hypothetical protein